MRIDQYFIINSSSGVLFILQYDGRSIDSVIDQTFQDGWPYVIILKIWISTNNILGLTSSWNYGKLFSYIMFYEIFYVNSCVEIDVVVFGDGRD